MDFGLQQMVLNHGGWCSLPTNGKILMLVRKNQNPSYVFTINIDEPHPFLGLEWWRFTTMEKCHEF